MFVVLLAELLPEKSANLAAANRVPIHIRTAASPLKDNPSSSIASGAYFLTLDAPADLVAHSRHDPANKQ
jgi:hypothetical protein